jgi:hypothetical protein
MKVLQDRQITHLYLEHNGLAIKGLMILAVGLVSSGTVVELTVKSNRLCDRTVKTLENIVR